MSLHPFCPPFAALPLMRGLIQAAPVPGEMREIQKEKECQGDSIDFWQMFIYCFGSFAFY